jgi:putative PIN family toxin of toxin-antitoxin system
VKSKFVFDTNALISALLSPSSTNARAVKRAEMLGEVVYSDESWTEFSEVLFRKKFDPFFTIEERQAIADRLLFRFIKEEVTVSIDACRDPKDNMFLELAVSVGATCLISGDSDLLVLHPFRGVPIMRAADFLEKF